MDTLVKIPNRVPEKQRYYQNNLKPVYYRAPRSNLYFNAWFTGLFIGLSGVGWGAFQMIKGKPTEAE